MNCRQLFPKSRADALALAAFARVCVREYRRPGGNDGPRARKRAGQARAEWPPPILMCESLGTITAITRAGRKSAHYPRPRPLRRFPRPLPFTLRANLERASLPPARSSDERTSSLSPLTSDEQPRCGELPLVSVCRRKI